MKTTTTATGLILATMLTAPAAAFATTGTTADGMVIIDSDDIDAAEAQSITDVVEGMNDSHDEKAMVIITDAIDIGTPSAYAEQMLDHQPEADVALVIEASTETTGTAFSADAQAAIEDYNRADVNTKLADATEAQGPVVGANTAVSTFFRHIEPAATGSDAHARGDTDQAGVEAATAPADDMAAPQQPETEQQQPETEQQQPSGTSPRNVTLAVAAMIGIVVVIGAVLIGRNDTTQK